MESVVTCVCGKSFRAAPHLAGKRVKCPSCGGSIDIPQAGLGADGDDQVFASPHPAISASPPGEHEEVKDEYGFGLPPSDGGVDAGFWDACAPQEANSAAAALARRTSRQCPHCQTPVEDDAVACLACHWPITEKAYAKGDQEQGNQWKDRLIWAGVAFAGGNVLAGLHAVLFGEIGFPIFFFEAFLVGVPLCFNYSCNLLGVDFDWSDHWWLVAFAGPLSILPAGLGIPFYLAAFAYMTEVNYFRAVLVHLLFLALLPAALFALVLLCLPSIGFAAAFGLWSGDESHPPAHQRHRPRTHAAQHLPGQGQEPTDGAALTAASDGAPRVLEGTASGHVSVSGQDARRPLGQRQRRAGLQRGGGLSPVAKHVTPHRGIKGSAYTGYSDGGRNRDQESFPCPEVNAGRTNG